MNSPARKVLIVDDDPSSLKVLMHLLKSVDYQVQKAISGKEARKVLKDFSPDLILLDILMPDIDGYELCRELKNNSKYRHIPIIFITSANKTDEVVKGFEAGAVDYITKPINKAEMLARVGTHLELKYSRDQIANANKDLLQEVENRKQAEEKFKALSENAFEAVLFLKDGNIIEANKAAYKLFGLQENKDEFQKIDAFVDVSGKKILEKISKHADNGIWELVFYKNDKSRFYGLIQHQPFQYKNEMINVLAIRDITKQKEHEKEILNAILETQEDERKRFSKDLHDGLGALLSTLKIYVGLLQKENKDMQQKQDLLNEMKSTIKQALESTRSIANNLMPSILTEYGFVRALKSFADAINKTESVNIEFSYPENLKSFDNNTETHIYRIALELINNTLKHAGANNIFIKVYSKDNYLFIDYKDDGKGFDFQEAYTRKGGGQGLKNIFSRINFLNGKGTYFLKNNFLHFHMEIPIRKV